MEDLMFRQYMSQLLAGAKDTASFKAAYSTPTPPVDDTTVPDPNAIKAPRIADNTAATNATGNNMTDHTVDSDDDDSKFVDAKQKDTTDEFFTNLFGRFPGGQQIKEGIDSIFGEGIDVEGSGLKSALKKQQRTGKRGPRGRLILGEGLTPLGKHFLDTYDLENHNKVCIRYQGGKLVKAIPAKVVGGTVAGALKSIVKGKAPSAMDVEKMTEDERNYLNLISSKAHVKQLQVPSKDKTAEEKLLHKFDTMKGQIIAGNDNKDLIKEFKLLLLKLKQMSKISKDDVNEILMDLAALGY